MTAEKKQELLKKIENIWFYYKWYIIIGTLMAAFVIYACAQCANRVETDMNIIFVTGSDNVRFTDATCGEMQYFIRREYATDADGDGQVSVKYFHYQVAEDITKTDTTTQQAITMSIYDAESFLIICDDKGYEHLTSIGGEEAVDVLEPLSNVVAGENIIDDYRISLEGTALGELDTINETGEEEELFACLRVFTGAKEEDDRDAKQRYDYACDVLRRILADKKTAEAE